MGEPKRPISVTLVAVLYIAVGAAGFVFHFRGLRASGGIPWGGISVELVEAAAIVFGAFLLRGHNWARWAALAWIVFHVLASALGALPGLAIHSAFCVAIAWALFHRGAGRYFRNGTTSGGRAEGASA